VEQDEREKSTRRGGGRVRHAQVSCAPVGRRACPEEMDQTYFAIFSFYYFFFFLLSKKTSTQELGRCDPGKSGELGRRSDRRVGAVAFFFTCQTKKKLEVCNHEHEQGRK
jgi:hypothetical protein